MSLPVLVINRDQDRDRLARFSASAAQYGLDFERIPALDAHAPGFPFRDHADMIADHFWGQPDIKPGAIGCFLSHRLAWQHVADAGLDRALVCEDDTLFLRDPAGLAQAALPPDGVTFANGRLAAWARAASQATDIDLPSVIEAVAARGGPKAAGAKPSPGADCYLLGAGAARRLLDITAGQGIVCGVDWAMVWNALAGVSEQAAQAFPELRILQDHVAPTAMPVAMRILTDPVGDQAGKGGSTIRHAITRPIAGLHGD